MQPHLPGGIPACCQWRHCAALALALALGGCAADHHRAPLADTPGLPQPVAITAGLLKAQQQERERRSNAELGTLEATAAPAYAIGPGDVLAIVVWDHPELTAVGPATAGTAGTAERETGANPTITPAAAEFVVGHDGCIEFPFAGRVPLAGLDQPRAAALLTARLARYLRDPRLSLRMRAYRSQRVYVGGEVRQPGQLAIDDIPMSLLEALSRAGGLLPTADQSRILLMRGGVSHRIDLIGSARGAHAAASMRLLSGDIVRVAPRDESKVFVSGEVLAPKALPMHDGRLSLNEALGEAGGIDPRNGDTRRVYVVRRGVGGAEVYQLDASSAGALVLAEQFELAARDVVYVAPSPLANWHRAVSLLFPGELSSAVGAARP